MAATLIRGARPVPGWVSGPLVGVEPGEPVDVLVEDGVVAAIAPVDSFSQVRDRPVPQAGLEVVDAEGRALGSGLWDAHVHFTQWVVQRTRIDVSAATSADHALQTLRAARERDPGPVGAWVIGFGFRDALWPDRPTRAALDAAVPDRPVALVSGDLHCGWVNTEATRQLGLPTARDAAHDDDLVREGPWLAALERLDDAPSLAQVDDAVRAAAGRGVVGIVDLERENDLGTWVARARAGLNRLRVRSAIWPERLEEAITAGLRTGDPLDVSGLITLGPLKVMADGSLNTRTAWCHDPCPGVTGPEPTGVHTYDDTELERLLVRAWHHGIVPAVHAIGDRTLTQVVRVLARHGIGGSIEHAQLVREADLPAMAAAGLVASVQPEHAMDDRDVAERWWPGRTGRAFAYGSMHRAGVRLRLGSDAPVAPLDPWLGIAAAVTRSRDGREVWHPEQRLGRDVALAASVDAPLATGGPADLVLLDADPLTCAPEVLRAMPVAATMVGGRWTHRWS